MSVEVQFQFIGGARGVVVLDYDHFKHGSKGNWSSLCPLIGRSRNQAPNKLPQPTPGNVPASTGTFEIVGGVVSMYEKDEQGRNALSVEMRYFPKLGGVSAQEMKSRKFEGPFRIYRAQINDSNTGTWHIVGEAAHWARTAHGASPQPTRAATPP